MYELSFDSQHQADDLGIHLGRSCSESEISRDVINLGSDCIKQAATCREPGLPLFALALDLLAEWLQEVKSVWAGWPRQKLSEAGGSLRIVGGRAGLRLPGSVAWSSSRSWIISWLPPPIAFAHWPCRRGHLRTCSAIWARRGGQPGCTGGGGHGAAAAGGGCWLVVALSPVAQLDAVETHAVLSSKRIDPIGAKTATVLHLL